MQQAAARITQSSQAAAQLAADRSLQSAVCIGIIATLPCAFYSLLAWRLLAILSFGNHWQYCHLVLSAGIMQREKSWKQKDWSYCHIVMAI